MDQELKMKTYNPNASSYAPRIKNEQWDQHKSLLKHLHDTGYTRAHMLEVLQKQNFNPTIGQLNAKMTAWGFKVYGTQSESPDQQSTSSYQETDFDYFHVDMADTTEDDPTLSPTSRRSISSTTLCDPEKPSAMSDTDANMTLEDVIFFESLTLAGSYVPTTRPSDFVFSNAANKYELTESHYRSVVLVADFLSAVHCFEQAFDLYYHIFELVVGIDRNSTTYGSVIRSLIQCAMSATSDAQCDYISSVLQRAYAWCAEHARPELTSCLSCLIQDLRNRDLKGKTPLYKSQYNQVQDTPLLIMTDERSEALAYRREWLQQQLSACDQSCATLTHLSSWCQDTLSFYRLDKSQIRKHLPQRAGGQLSDLAVFEHDFQRIACALVIDYLNSPGPTMKKADIDCKDDVCLFRWALSPSTSLLVMAHLIFEPLRLQSEAISDAYLYSRAQTFTKSQSTSPLAELKSFASADSATRCGAFVDTFMRHFNTTLVFRRFVSSIEDTWNRMAAAKRLAQLISNNPTGFMPHAGLPSARRAALKSMASPFGHDPSLTESRPSIVSESDSMGDFKRLAQQIDLGNQPGGSRTPSDAMSIDTRSSWSFHQVTGFASGLYSRGNSISVRKEDFDEMEEYRHFIKDNNYSQPTQPPYSDTPAQRHPPQKGKHP